ncbi:hypothetical protein M1N05_02230 [Dehalococcoidales bacterium]|nr:hypothetical protein [Dehalococcoidales bacterium]
MSLSDSELWERVRGLEEETVYTIQQCKPNRILRVTADKVEIAERKTKPSREDILRVYHHLQRMGRVTREDLYGNASILKNPLARKTGRIIMAILAAAVPEEIDVIPETERLSGIRLRGQ